MYGAYENQGMSARARNSKAGTTQMEQERLFLEGVVDKKSWRTS